MLHKEAGTERAQSCWFYFNYAELLADCCNPRYHPVGSALISKFSWKHTLPLTAKPLSWYFSGSYERCNWPDLLPAVWKQVAEVALQQWSDDGRLISLHCAAESRVVTEQKKKKRWSLLQNMCTGGCIHHHDASYFSKCHTSPEPEGCSYFRHLCQFITNNYPEIKMDTLTADSCYFIWGTNKFKPEVEFYDSSVAQQFSKL